MAKIHYYSPALTQKLDKIMNSSVTIIEAPSGYGKTTAVQDWITEGMPKGIAVYLWNAAEDAPDSSWHGLCDKIGAFSPASGTRLKALGFPNPANCWEISEILHYLDSSEPVILVLDDFQFIQNAVPKTVITGLMSVYHTNLHIVIITQSTYTFPLNSFAGERINYLKPEDFCLSVKEIVEYCAMYGIETDAASAMQLYEYTEGWILALYLTVRQIKLGEKPSFNMSILQMMEGLVWDRLSEQEKDLFLHLSYFPEIQPEQISFLLEQTFVEPWVRDVLQRTPFIHQDGFTGHYRFHAVLREMLLRRLNSLGTQRSHYDNMAGKRFARQGERIRAFECFFRTCNFEEFLSMSFVDMNLQRIEGKPFVDAAQELLSQCPSEIKQKHIISLLQIAYAYIGARREDWFYSLMVEISGYIEEIDNEQEKDVLRGEWRLIWVFRKFPDVILMESELKAAADMIKGKSRTILPGEPFMFALVDMMYLHTKKGRIEEEIKAVDGICQILERLTGEKICADILFRATVAFYRGDLTEGEIQCYRAYYLSMGSGQWIIRLAIAHILARIGHKNGKADFLDNLSYELSQIVGGDKRKGIFADLVWTDCFIWVGLPKMIPKWLQETNASDFSDAGLGLRNALNYISVIVAYQASDFMRMIGIIEAFIREEKPSCHLETYMRIISALGYSAMGLRDMAREQLLMAPDCCMPDGIILPFIEFKVDLGGLLEEVFSIKNIAMPEEILGSGKIFYDNAVILAKLISGIGEQMYDLTRRELEIANLAAKGKTNKEIAEELFISETTVRSHLRTVFSKLGINRRGKIAEMLKKR